MNGTDENPIHDSGAAQPGVNEAAAPAGDPQSHSGYAQPRAASAPAPIPAQASDPRAKSPALACVLSAMPGLGQIYVGYYQRGFVHALVVAVLITMLATGDLDELTPLAGLFLAFFWLYNIIDAGRRATLYNQALAGTTGFDLPSDFEMPRFRGSVFGGLLLIGFGFALLLHTRWDVSLRWVEEWWPVAPILLGGWLIAKAIQDRSQGRLD
jgi:hypothetical protein